jgi:hypothetical protein
VDLALRQDTGPDLGALAVDDVHRGALGVEQGRRRVGDPAEDHVDVGLERELAVE